jgi:membrane-bound inhibitor of C-type lysozyme
MNKRTLADAGVLALVMTAGCAGRVAPSALARAGTTAVFRCGQTTVGARFAGGTLDLQLGGGTYHLDRVEAASGARYTGKTASDNVEFWNKGREATLKVGDQTYPTCQQADGERD